MKRINVLFLIISLPLIYNGPILVSGQEEFSETISLPINHFYVLNISTTEETATYDLEIWPKFFSNRTDMLIFNESHYEIYHSDFMNELTNSGTWEASSQYLNLSGVMLRGRVVTEDDPTFVIVENANFITNGAIAGSYVKFDIEVTNTDLTIEEGKIFPEEEDQDDGNAASTPFMSISLILLTLVIIIRKMDNK